MTNISVLLIVVFFLLLLKVEWGTVDAVSQASGTGSIVKDMPQVGIATLTEDFSTPHTEGSVRLSLYIICAFITNFKRVVEGWPTGAGVKLVLRGEQVGVTANTFVHPFVLVVVVEPGPGALSTVTAGNLVLYTRKQHRPVCIAHILWFLSCLLKQFRIRIFSRISLFPRGRHSWHQYSAKRCSPP